MGTLHVEAPTFLSLLLTFFPEQIVQPRSGLLPRRWPSLFLRLSLPHSNALSLSLSLSLSRISFSIDSCEALSLSSPRLSYNLLCSRSFGDQTVAHTAQPCSDGNEVPTAGTLALARGRAHATTALAPVKPLLVQKSSVQPPHNNGTLRL